MTGKSVQERIQGLWWRAKQLPSLEALSAELVANWAQECGIAVDSVEGREIGRFPTLLGRCLEGRGAHCLLPQGFRHR